MLLLLYLTLAILHLTSGQETVNCPTDNSIQVPEYTDQCCDKISSVLPDRFYSEETACKQLLPTVPSAFDRKESRACFEECIFTLHGLLSDHRLNSAAIVSLFTTSVDPGLRSEVTGAVHSCADRVQNNIDTRLQCQSGADDFMACFARTMITNCPPSHFKSSRECSELQMKVNLCPNTLVILNSPPKVNWERIPLPVNWDRPLQQLI